MVTLKFYSINKLINALSVEKFIRVIMVLSAKMSKVFTINADQPHVILQDFISLKKNKKSKKNKKI